MARAIEAGRGLHCSLACAGHVTAIKRGHTSAASMRKLGFTVELSTILVRAYHHTKKNSKTRGIEFSLTRPEFVDLATRARGRCEISGIEFTTNSTTSRFERRPWLPSIDRIDSQKGYTFDNCRLVCVAVNLAMNTWGLPTLELLAEAIYTTRKGSLRAA